MRIRLTGVFVEDQAQALRFYTERLGFVKKLDISAGNYRFLTVVSPEEPDGTSLLLESNAHPAARAFQKARREQGIAVANFFVEDLASEVERLTKLGVKFTQGLTKTVGSSIAILDDTCGNLVQITQLDQPMM
jgi:catechol 2,3-dioxygenase-like lactoylglutathione lyase family enzyme